MKKGEKEGKSAYKVVVNQEGRYSIWPADRENARGSRDAGMSGTEQECVAYVEKVQAEKRPPKPEKKTEKTGGK